MYDCIIVGAGPAGGTAAYHLSKLGRSVLILEREVLPRYKPCGGCVSPSIAEWFDFDFSPAISVKADTIRCTWKMADAIEVELQTPEPVWLVRRDVFDHFIVQQAQKQGTELRDNTEVIGIEFKSNHWQVNTKNGFFQGRYIIAADGASGRMAKWLGFKNRLRRLAGALEAEAPAKMDRTNVIDLEFGIVKNGYAWNFPKADGYSIGVGNFIGGKAQNFKKVIDEYGKSFNLNVSTCQQYAYALCLWNGEQTLHTTNAILTGETACVVDPMTAEGIRPSIVSALKASAAIDKAISGDINALENYSNTINQEWGADMALAAKVAGLFYRFPNLGYRVGVKRPSALQIMGKILCGQLRYYDVAGRAIQCLTSLSG